MSQITLEQRLRRGCFLRTPQTAITLLGEEIDAGPPESGAVIPSLVDAVLILILRAWLEDQGNCPDGGWSRGMVDTAAARSIELIHARPGAPWRVAVPGDVRPPLHRSRQRTPLTHLAH